MKCFFYSDPAHGWLKVPKKLLTEFNIKDKISTYSYERNNYVYLEEDCDMSIFLDSAHNNSVRIDIIYNKQSNKMSKIRSYNSYNKDK